MKREAVDSSMIASVGYDPDDRILEVEFTSGTIYQYEDVPPEEFMGLMNSDSKGQYMLSNIIDMYDYSSERRHYRSHIG